ncbi:MAG: transcriptional repressor [Candidatus Krumholzibacteria bacterium]|nr:transcriptional repressor [Candidatus Krumholzibacteria bacterium]
MKVPNEELQRRLRRLREELSAAGIKQTHQRLEIFREVAGSGDHPCAETVYRGVRRRVPSISLDTVYRTLWLLLDLGLVGTLGRSRDRTRFDADTRPHHHFVCSRCGMTMDFYSEEFDGLGLPGGAGEIGSARRARVEIEGICADCARSDRKERRRKDE